MAYDPGPWLNFYVVTGGAAAALTGLLFVAMSLHAKQIMANSFFSTRAVGTLMSLTSQLLLSACVLIPGQPLALLGVEVEVVALLFLAYTLIGWLRRRPDTAPVASTWTHRIIERGGGTVWLVLFILTGFSLLFRVGGGLYLLAAVMFFMFAWNIYIAWILITEVSEAG